MHRLLLAEVQLRHLSRTNLNQWHFGGIFILSSDETTQLGNHSITKVSGVVVLCKGPRTRISFQSTETPKNPNTLKLMNPETFTNPKQFPLV